MIVIPGDYPANYGAKYLKDKEVVKLIWSLHDPNIKGEWTTVIYHFCCHLDHSERTNIYRLVAVITLQGATHSSEVANHTPKVQFTDRTALCHLSTAAVQAVLGSIQSHSSLSVSSYFLSTS